VDVWIVEIFAPNRKLCFISPYIAYLSYNTYLYFHLPWVCAVPQRRVREERGTLSNIIKGGEEIARIANSMNPLRFSRSPTATLGSVGMKVCM
jgi:hypothetical protein